MTLNIPHATFSELKLASILVLLISIFLLNLFVIPETLTSAKLAAYRTSCTPFPHLSVNIDKQKSNPYDHHVCFDYSLLTFVIVFEITTQSMTLLGETHVILSCKDHVHPDRLSTFLLQISLRFLRYQGMPCP